MWRYFLWLIVVFGLFILLLILLIPGGKKSPTAQPLYSYANSDAVARLTIDGPINSDQNHQSIQISVDRFSVTYDQYQGYDGHVARQQTYASSPAAYDNFLHALYHGGFTLGNTPANLTDEKGYCPLGDRYIFEFINGGQEIERYWATSCGSPKTFKGNIALTLTLFQAQVPDYVNLSESVNL